MNAFTIALRRVQCLEGLSLTDISWVLFVAACVTLNGNSNNHTKKLHSSAIMHRSTWRNYGQPTATGSGIRRRIRYGPGIEAMVVRGLLESAGIEAFQTGLDAPQDILPGVGGVVLRVPASQAAEARELIEEYRMAGAAEEGELNSEEPAE